MAASTSSMGNSTTAQPLEEMQRTLKVSWDRRDGGYTAAQLREVFEAYGPVVDIVMRDSKKKPDKGSALVIMAATQVCQPLLPSSISSSQNGELC